jgi:hypothetical protein
MPDDVSHLCHTEPFCEVIGTNECLVRSVGIPEGMQRLTVDCNMARPARLELATSWFVARRSIQLS